MPDFAYSRVAACSTARPAGLPTGSLTRHLYSYTDAGTCSLLKFKPEAGFNPSENALQVIVLASRKGGAGKTTLSSHLAVEAERAGAGRVALADLDPQGGLAAWFNARAAATPVYIDTSKGLAAAVRACRAGNIDLLFCDTPPSVTDVISSVVKEADLVVVPVRPSPNDLRAVGGTVEIVAKARKPLVFVVNQVTPRARITAEAAIALSQHGTVAPSMLASRVDFATSMTDGRTAGELDPSSRSSAEVAALWSYINSRLKEVSRG